jgi:hypothetical protein
VSLTNILAGQGKGKHEAQALTCQLLLLSKQFSASLLLPTLRSEFHFFDPGNPIARLPSLGKGHASTSIVQELSWAINTKEPDDNPS